MNSGAGVGGVTFTSSPGAVVVVVVTAGVMGLFTLSVVPAVIGAVVVGGAVVAFPALEGVIVAV